MVRRAVLALVGVAAVFALAGSAAPATDANRFTAAIAPTAVQPLSTGTYAVQITNQRASNTTANNAHVVVPDGFVVDPTSLSATTTASDTCPAATWNVTLTSTIDAVAPDAGSELCPGGRLSISFAATAPSAEGGYTWTASLLHDSTAFSLQGGQPVVIVDGTPPPAPTITAEPSDPSNDPAPSFSFTDGDGTATFLCQLDGSAASPCESPTGYSSLGEGAHTFAVTAVDPAGNQSATTSYDWTIDLTPPPAPAITSEPPSVTNSTSATFAFSDDDGSATFQCRLDGGAFAACSSPVTYDGLGEGSHTFRVKAVDPAGNESTVTAYTWTIDLTPPPAPTITSAPPNPTNSTSATFSFSDGDGSATFRCRLDSAGFAACSSPISYQQLAEGTHTFRVKALDPAGNESTVSSYTWTIDLTPPPAPTITSAPPSLTDSTSATFSFEDGDGSASFQCRLDDSVFSPCTSPITYNGLGEGSHTFRVKAIDAAGNESAVTSYTWTIDLTNPIVTIDPASEPHDPTNQTGASFVFTSNKVGSTFECRLDGADFSACSSPETYSGLADGRHSFAVRATDQLGHVGLPAMYDWTVDTVPPVTTITSGPPAVSHDPSATFEFASNEPGSTYACSLDGAAFAGCSSPQIYVGLADGSHTFQIQATDLAGNTEQTPASYTWQVATAPPPDTIPPGPVTGLKRIVGYRLLKLVWSMPNDPDFAFVRVTRSRRAGGPANTLVYEGTRTSYVDKRFQNGTYYRYEIRAFDSSGNGSSLVRTVISLSALLRSPRDGSVVKAPPLLLWSGVRKATYYNVQLYRGSQKILSAWPAKASLKLRSKWTYKGRRYRLQKGLYRWWVWPAFGPRSKGSYGQPIGTSTFVVR